MNNLGMVAAAALFTAAGAGIASAQEAPTTGDINMRAGPGTRYPVVETIPEGRPVMIHGCLSDYDWCDVSWRRERGCVFSEYLEYLYRERPVEFYEYRRRVDVPVISFGFGYWERNYRNRAWFDEWDYWGGDRRRVRARDDDRRGDDRDNAGNDRRGDDNQNPRLARNREDDSRNQARSRNRPDDAIDRTGSTSRANDDCLDRQGNNVCEDDRRQRRNTRGAQGDDDEQGNRRNDDGFGEGGGGVTNN